MENSDITAVVLAGGKARRFNYQDKGLLKLNGQSLVQIAVNKLLKETPNVAINANRNLEAYKSFKLPVFKDDNEKFLGPLSGMLSALKHANTSWVAFAPCDTPFFPHNLINKLKSAVENENVLLAYAKDEKRAHPVFCLMSTKLAPILEDYLAQGERRLLKFMQSQSGISVVFKQSNAFININTPEDLATFNLQPTIPIIGITGYSGSGKTTLLEKLLPKLKAKGIKAGVIKHTHHNVKLDKPGKDSWKMQQAGASQVLLTCVERWGLMTETLNAPASFDYLSSLFDTNLTDLILVEGFKHEPLDKILVHRDEHRPLDHIDEYVIAIACDRVNKQSNIPLLDLNNIEQISSFIYQWWQQQK